MIPTVPRPSRELRMTPELRAALRAHKRAEASAARASADQDARKAAIRAARDAGHNLEEIGQALGLSRQRIHRILN